MKSRSASTAGSILWLIRRPRFATSIATSWVAEPTQTVSVVRTADLDLSTDAGRKALDHRLVTAAFEVCGTASDMDLAGKNSVRQCRSAILAKARERSEQLASRDKGVILMAASR